MVHKKYIKRDGRIFGPYLYENYRENGVVKTRYLGKGEEKARVNFKVLFVIAVVLILVGLIIYSNFVYDKGERAKEEGGLFNLFDLFNFFGSRSVGVSVEVGAGQSGYGNGGGGGGGGGFPIKFVNKTCNESWACGEFLDCRNLILVFELGEISVELKKGVEDGCAVWNWSSDFCGVQKRECYDQNNCNTSISKPGIIKECYYIEEEKPGIIGHILKQYYFFTCLILLILVSLLVFLEEYLLRKYFLLTRVSKILKEKERKLKKKYLTLSLLLVLAIILFLISYCWVCVKLYLLVPVIVLIMVVLARYAIRRYREGYKK